MTRNFFGPKSWLLACVLLWTQAALAVDYIPLDLSALKDSDLSLLTGGADYALVVNGASGVWSPSVGPVPFDVGAAGTNRMWFSECNYGIAGACGDTLSVTTSVANATGVYTLINTGYGVLGPSARVTLRFAGGGTQVTDLAGGFDIRDHNQASWPNSVSSPNTVTVFDNGLRRLDRQFIAISPAFAGQTLTSIDILDTVPGGSSELLVTGVTVAAVPEPSAFGLMIVGVCVVGWRLRRRI